MAKFMSSERTPVPTEREAVGAPRLVWTFWRSGKSVVPAGIRTTDRPARSINLTSTTTQVSAYGILIVCGRKPL